MDLIQELSKKAFWDVDMKTMDVEKHAAFIIEKVFERGSLPDIKNVMAYYGKDKVSHALINSNFLMPDTLQFASSLLQIPKDHFKCYTKTRSLQTAGTYSRN